MRPKQSILLVIPPSPFLLDERVFLSLGILKVAASLEASGHPTRVLDLSGIENYEEVATLALRQSSVDAVGITSTTPQLPAAVRISAAIRAERPGLRLILGGPHATLVASAVKLERKRGLSGRAHRAFAELLKNFDVIVSGDGEHAVHEAIRTGGSFVDADDPRGTLFLTNRSYEESPMPARHLVDLKSYKYSIDGFPATSLIAQLGCPFGCGFCGGRNSSMLRKIRTRSIESIVGEIEYLHRTYGYTGFMCYDEDTEILTKDRGFIHFRELSPSDEVAVLHPETSQLAFEVPKRIIRKPFNGELITIKSRYVDLAVTPEHRMWVKLGESGYTHVTAQDMVSRGAPTRVLQRAEWVGEEFPSFSIPAYETVFLGRNKGSPKVQRGQRTFPAAIWVQFMAWYLAEGSCYRPKVRNGYGYRICIKQDLHANPKKVEEIRVILNALGYRFSYSSNQFHIDSRELYEYLRPFGKSKTKYVPAEFKLMSSELILLFLRTYMKGDGHITKGGQESIVSHSARMLGDLQEMAVKAGYWAAIDAYHRLLLSRQRDHRVNDGRNPFGAIRYKGDVHCVTVSTGIILVRRRGKIVWSGNCYDDELNVNKSLVPLMHAIADLQSRLGVEFRLRGFIKSELFNEEQAQAMYSAGFRWLLCGFEAAAPRILENINKRATLDDNDRVIETAHRHGLKVKALMSVGHPGETEDSILAVERWLVSRTPDDFDCTVITTYPGTPYYDEAVPSADYPNVWTYTALSGDRLHSIDVDYTVTADYYKGDPAGGYRAYVFTDHLSSDEIVRLRNEVERSVRHRLNIPFNPGAPGVRYEHSMGQGALPEFILKETP